MFDSSWVTLHIFVSIHVFSLWSRFQSVQSVHGVNTFQICDFTFLMLVQTEREKSKKKTNVYKQIKVEHSAVLLDQAGKSYFVSRNLHIYVFTLFIFIYIHCCHCTLELS